LTPTGGTESPIQGFTVLPPVGDGSSNQETVEVISEAKANFQRISPRKARMVINLVRGRSATEALQLLDFTTKAAAPIVKKLLASALANAKQLRPEIDVDGLYVSRASVDKGPDGNMRRWRPRAMGRATQVTKGVSHIHLELDEL
jgi:large subunit ribosomal protein L22